MADVGFIERASLGMVMVKCAEQYSGTFAELQRARDDKVHRLKTELPDVYANIASSIRTQRWLDLLCGLASGGAQMGSTLVDGRVRPILAGMLKAAGEGGAVRGVQQFVDASCQANQQIDQGKRSEKESQREAIIQGGNSHDQAFQGLLQTAKDVSEIEKQSGLR